jgi:hypothetical protein
VADGKLSGVGFEGGKAVAKFKGGSVEGCAGEVTHRGDGGAECSTNLPFQEVELGVVEEAEVEGEVLADEEASDDAESAGLC